MPITCNQSTPGQGAQKEVIAADEVLANEAPAGVQDIKDECERDLAEATPMEGAVTSLDTLKLG